MKVRILSEQQTHHSQPDRRYLASGEEVDIDNTWALDLLRSGQAEVIEAKTPAKRAEKRPSRSKSEKR